MLRLLERLLVVSGCTAVAWCALMIADATEAQRQAMATLREKPASVRANSVRAAQAAMSVVDDLHHVPPGTALAELEIPRLHLAEAVLEGSDDRTLRRGPGHIEQTSLPGHVGNIGIAGHRDTFFRPLRSLKVGDDIFLTTDGEISRYRVWWLNIVAPDDVGVLDRTNEPSLTLVTCYPFWFVGPAPLRYVVRAVRVESDVCEHALCGLNSRRDVRS